MWQLFALQSGVAVDFNWQFVLPHLPVDDTNT